MSNDLISVFKVATEIEKVAPITGRLRAIAGMYGPVVCREGDGRRTLMVSKAELRKRGILPAEPPITEAHRKEIGGAVMLCIGEAADRIGLDLQQRLHVFDLFMPALKALMPDDAEVGGSTGEGSTEGQSVDSSST